MRPIEVVYGSRVYVCWSVGVLCVVTGLTHDAIRSLERHGLIPGSPVRWGRTRYYPDALMRNASALFSGPLESGRLLYYEAIWDAISGEYRALWDGAPDVIRPAMGVRHEPSGVMFWTIDGVAKEAGRSVGTVRDWGRWRTLPLSHITWGGSPVYPEFFVDRIVGLGDSDQFSVKVSDAWEDSQGELSSLGIRTDGGVIDVKKKPAKDCPKPRRKKGSAQASLS